MSQGEDLPRPAPEAGSEAAPPVSPGSAPGRPPGGERPGCGGTLWALGAVLLGGAYLLNPGWGVLELLPDNLPGFGNLDEAGAAALLIFGLRHLLGRRSRS